MSSRRLGPGELTVALGKVVAPGPGAAVRGRFIVWRKRWQDLVEDGKQMWLVLRAGDGWETGVNRPLLLRAGLQAHLKVSFCVTLSTSEPEHKAPSQEHGDRLGHSPHSPWLTGPAHSCRFPGHGKGGRTEEENLDPERQDLDPGCHPLPQDCPGPDIRLEIFTLSAETPRPIQ